MSWGVSVTDVQNITATAVDAPTLAMADEMVTIYVNRTPEASSGIGDRDLGWITRAVSWQAAWLATNVNVVSRQQFDTMSQDGVSLSSTAQWAKVLAPMAARALKNLSWKGTRTVGPEIQREAYDFVMEDSDEYSDWHTL